MVTSDPNCDAQPQELTFTTADWDTPQTVMVHARDDGVVEAEHAETNSDGNVGERAPTTRDAVTFVVRRGAR